jgi:hypothetical protein
MESEEKTLALIESLSNYNFFVTNKRLFIITKEESKLKNGAALAAFAATFGLIVAYREHQQRKEELKGISIAFNDVYFIALNKKRHGGEVLLNAKNCMKSLKIDQEQFTKLTQLLPTIPQLKEKVKISN